MSFDVDKLLQQLCDLHEGLEVAIHTRLYDLGIPTLWRVTRIVRCHRSTSERLAVDTADHLEIHRRYWGFYSFNDGCPTYSEDVRLLPCLQTQLLLARRLAKDPLPRGFSHCPFLSACQQVDYRR
jgi:hypothetical protein